MHRPGAYFVLEGRPFCFGGTNNYYLINKPRQMVDDLLERAQAMQLKVIRIKAHMDRGALDHSMQAPQQDATKDGVYFQYWDPAAQRPAYNQGDNGLPRLDYVLSRARASGLKLILVLTNNWPDYGGMDQYLVWYGLTKHHEFYTDGRVRQAYKDWVAHLIQRTNTLDGTPYRDDPAIFSWQLANEPRCRNATAFDSPEGWDSATITRWADEMSRFIQSLDPNHMVSVGDEGFLNLERSHWAYQAPHGVDHQALSSLSSIDFATFHLYPDNWATGYSFAHQWITDHLEVALEIGKPTVMEEYGTRVRRNRTGKIVWGLDRRLEALADWHARVVQGGASGALFWMLAGLEPNGKRYPDYDGFTLYSDDETAGMLRDLATAMPTDARPCRFAENDPALGSEPPSRFVRVHAPPAGGG